MTSLEHVCAPHLERHPLAARAVSLVIVLLMSFGASHALAQRRPPEQRPYLTLTTAELDQVTSDAWRDIAVGIVFLAGGVTIGAGVGVPIGLASQRYEVTWLRCNTFCLPSETMRRDLVGHDQGLLGVAIGAGVVGLVLAVAGVLGWMVPAAPRGLRAARERRWREIEATSSGSIAIHF